MHRCSRGCDFDLCESCLKTKCFQVGDWVRTGHRGVASQLHSIDEQGEAVVIGHSRIHSVSPGVFSKVTENTHFSLEDGHLVEAGAGIVAEKDRLRQELAEVVCERDQLRGNSLDNLSLQQLNQLASQVGSALVRILALQEQKRHQAVDCVVCSKEARAVVFQPCNHHCCCENCAESLDKCPVCKATIAERVRAFSS